MSTALMCSLIQRKPGMPTPVPNTCGTFVPMYQDVPQSTARVALSRKNWLQLCGYSRMNGRFTTTQTSRATPAV